MRTPIRIRSDEPPEDVERVIYALGGSTTIDVYLDQDETWVQQLQIRLNAVPDAPRTWVGNLGRTSLASIHNLIHLHYLIPTLPKADLLINLIGVNDLQYALKSGYLGEMSPRDHMFWAFSKLPLQGRFWDRLAIVRYVQRELDARKQASVGVVQTFDSSPLIAWRQCRQRAFPADLVDELPPLGSALEQYRENLNKLIDRSAQYGAPMIFATQPTLWADKMGPEETSRLLAGGIGPSAEWCETGKYFSPGALAAGMRRFNDTLLEICAKRDVPCIDLARKLPKEARYFRDDMHFSEEGARLVSDLIAKGLPGR